MTNNATSSAAACLSWQVGVEPFDSGYAVLTLWCDCGAKIYSELDELEPNLDHAEPLTEDEIYQMWDEHVNEK